MSTCLGPCQHWCKCTTTTTVFASASLVYAIACLFYLLGTRSLGTPFMDSLTPAQRDLKRNSAQVRGRIFCTGIAVGIALVACWRPFVPSPDR